MDFDGKRVFCLDGPGEISLKDIGNRVMSGNGFALEVTESNTQPTSPPPFMVGMAEVEVDRETGEAKLIDYVPVVDCGTPIPPNHTRIQTE